MKGHFGGRRNLYDERTFHYEKFHKEKRAMKNSFIRKPNSILQRGLFAERMVLLGKEKSTIIRKRNVYCIERVFDESTVLLPGKESSTIKKERKRKRYKWDYLMKGHFFVEKKPKEALL